MSVCVEGRRGGGEEGRGEGTARSLGINRREGRRGEGRGGGVRRGWGEKGRYRVVVV